MKKFLLGTLLLAASQAWAADIYLEGVTILGNNKTAYLTVGGNKLSVGEGGTVEGWTITAIEPRAVQLRNAEGQTQALELHSQLAELPAQAPTASVDGIPAEGTDAQPPAPINPEDNPFLQAMKARAEQQAQEQTMPPIETTPPQPAYEPKRIADEEIPPGHRRVRTPFGDVLVKEQP